ncbi:hypothetical protein ACJX0J_030520 [Zea mays]
MSARNFKNELAGDKYSREEVVVFLETCFLRFTNKHGGRVSPQKEFIIQGIEIDTHAFMTIQAFNSLYSNKYLFFRNKLCKFIIQEIDTRAFTTNDVKEADYKNKCAEYEFAFGAVPRQRVLRNEPVAHHVEARFG